MLPMAAPLPAAVPTQSCQHPSHLAWWGTDPSLCAVTDFYHRSSKCKKCYIRQQQESKTRRIAPSTPGSEPRPPNSPGAESTPGPLNTSAGITKSPYPTPPPPITTARLGPAPVAAPRPMPNFNMNPGMPNNMGMRPFTPGMPTFNAPPGVPFGQSPAFTPGTPAPQPFAQQQPQATTPFILSRPPREVNRKVLGAQILKKCKPILDSLRASEIAWPFNQPVDPEELGLDDYLEIIKKPMDLRTIEENLVNGKYQSETQFAEDIRLVWENARLYNKVESEIYDMSVELSEVFETSFKKVVKECEQHAKSEAEKEVRSDICAFCGFGIVIPSHQRPQQPTPLGLTMQPQKVQTQTQQITFQPSPAPGQPVPPPPLAMPFPVQVPSQFPQQPTPSPAPTTAPLPVQAIPPPSVASPSNEGTGPASPPTIAAKAEKPAPSPPLAPPNSPPLNSSASLSQPPNSPPQSSAIPPTPTSPITPLRAPPPAMPVAPLTTKPLPLGFAPSPMAKPVAAPVAAPLLHCDGACLRAFHPHCLNLTDFTTPWLCNECRTGKPVLHIDPAKSEYFYYYYDTTDTPISSEDSDTEVEDHHALGSLPRETKRKIREDEEDFRKDMYFDDMWCMWRCRTRESIQQRDDRQKQLVKKLATGGSAPER